MSLTKLEEHKCFDGVQYVFSHTSEITKSEMRFGIYLPPQATIKLPALYWLSGLTCTEQNFIQKSGAQHIAAKLGLIIINPDTSPRGLNIAGEDLTNDIGTGAGFYLDATQNPWSQGYKMYSYIVNEFWDVIQQHFSVDSARVGIFGHSMGGHGALTIALKNPNKFKSLSAFAPISSSMNSPWGIKALQTYLGTDEANWQAYDATCLIEKFGWEGPKILIDQGTNDEFINTQLKPELLAKACQKKGIPLELRYQDGYDHSYYFVSTFIKDHLHFHKEILDLICI